MANTKLSSIEKLKQFVDTIQEMYPDQRMFSRTELNKAAKDSGNLSGLLIFGGTAKYGGFDSTTKISRGCYIIPLAWTNGEAPWDPAPVEIVPVPVVVAKAPAKKKVKKAAAVECDTFNLP